MELGAFGFIPLAGTDVPGDLRGANDVTGEVLDGRNDQRDIDGRPILAAAPRFHFDRLSSSNPRQDHVFFGEPLPRNDDRDRLADRFGRRVPEYPFGAAVPRGDNAIQVLADDGIVGGLDDRGKSLRGAIRLLEGLLAHAFRQGFPSRPEEPLAILSMDVASRHETVLPASQAPAEREHEQNQKDQPKAAAGVITPSGAVGPGRQASEHEDNDQEKKNSNHRPCLPLPSRCADCAQARRAEQNTRLSLRRPVQEAGTTSTSVDTRRTPRTAFATCTDSR